MFDWLKDELRKSSYSILKGFSWIAIKLFVFFCLFLCELFFRILFFAGLHFFLFSYFFFILHTEVLIVE